MREPSHAGLLYERGERTLQEQIQRCFEDKQGPGETPPKAQAQKKNPLPKALIVPHAHYDFAGPCAAWGYKHLGEAPLADVYIIIGPSHKHATSGLVQEPFQTPLGIVRVDQDFTRRLLEKGTIKENPSLHEDEHSIEAQLPFLQFSHLEALERIKIVPLIIGSDIDLQKLAIDIKEVLVETKKKAVFIVSANFTHYGRKYHYSQFSADVQANIAKLDKGALDLIAKGDHAGLIKYVDETMMTLCGTLCIALLLRTIRFEKATLEQYYTSAAFTKDEKTSVSYATMVFW